MAKIEELLRRGESESLDFKRDQYNLAKDRSDEEKSEFVKDILALVNSWRTENAYIVIGVKNRKGEPKEIVGTATTADDADLQQFIQGKLFRPVTFSYSEFEYEGKKLGLIEIPVQRRPAFLKQDYGKLRRNIVYVRRGSSTEEATPDEIVEMATVEKRVKTGEVQLQFVDPTTERMIGSSLSLESQNLTVEEENSIDGIPDYEPGRGIGIYTDHHNNPDYYRELVEFVKQKLMLRRIGLTVSNGSKVNLHNIRAEIEIHDANRELEFCHEYEVKDSPSKRSWVKLPKIRSIAETISKDPYYEVDFKAGTWRLSFDFRDLQPSRTLLPGLYIFVGAKVTRSIDLNAKIFADELEEPIREELSIQITATQSTSTLDRLPRIVGDQSS